MFKPKATKKTKDYEDCNGYYENSTTGEISSNTIC